jgi:hypothetical protein
MSHHIDTRDLPRDKHRIGEGETPDSDQPILRLCCGVPLDPEENGGYGVHHAPHEEQLLGQRN